MRLTHGAVYGSGQVPTVDGEVIVGNIVPR